ncbi:MAG: pyruvate, phosphate dikinase [Candidatus Omnitrophica bacterium]|nr:pyruvate, phosphate dikinase [Candidatus Omnitrophota bacterium]
MAMTAKAGKKTKASKEKFVYFFGDGKADGKSAMKNLLGGKGANLAEMTNLGMPVPAGFTISTDVCTYYYDNNKKYPSQLKQDVLDALKKVEKAMGAGFGDKENPLLVSIRSGARVSMPGMMDTVLNLGLNDVTVKGLTEQTKNERFVYDAYRRFVQMFGDVVLGLKPKGKDEHDPFEVIMDKVKSEKGIKLDLELETEDLKRLVKLYKEEIKNKTGKIFPEDPYEQLWAAIGSVFESWNNERAIAYRRINKIPEIWGTAVNVQSMVFGNMGEDSGTGVAFTRDPATGEKKFYGEYLLDAQGEDVVAGTRTPQPIIQLEKQLKKPYDQLFKIHKELEKHYREMQDMEFTIQKGKLWMLQTRAGKRTGLAAIKIAVDMVDEKLISEEEALQRIEPEQLNQLLRPIFDLDEKRNIIKTGKLLAKGLNAGPGAACGKVVFNAVDAEEWAKRGEKVILVRIETSPEDITGMNAAVGILTARGGMTSHAALVARQMGKVCVAGCGALEINYTTREMKVKDAVIKEGDFISIDGATGEVISGQIKTNPSEILQVLIEKTLEPGQSEMYKLFDKIMKWADKRRRLKIRTNADQGDQALTALAFGAEGIGLCRTEHMFFGEGKIEAMREMILADDEAGRKEALTKLLPIQKKDFTEIFKVMKGHPVTIRTLDPPLHEFLPHQDEEIKKMAEFMNVSVEKIKAKIEYLKEVNPMLGLRGCRLGILYPEITYMQVTAIFQAACEVQKSGIEVKPEIMIPLVGHVNELKQQAGVVRAAAKKVMDEYSEKVKYSVGTMIELPRAALTADEIAEVAEFFSFGTNDLTQTTYGLSRDDAGKFLYYYYEKDILKDDPFQTVDQRGVGQLMEIATKKGRGVRKDLKIGICGEHGGESKSVEFCDRLGLNYVSCSPFRVPIARLAAAQAVVKSKKTKK